jgi:glutathionylspermidine synthase
MEREIVTPRPDYREKVLSMGLSYIFHGEEPYWNETACYRFSSEEIDTIEAAAQELHVICLQAVDFVIRNRHYDKFGIPDFYIPYIEESWRRMDPFIFGRFDLSYDGVQPPKMLEYNADTPTSLPEAAVAQWYWLEEQRENGILPPDADQFNRIHESLIAAWKRIDKETALPEHVYFTTLLSKEEGIINIDEDLINLEYMRDTCNQAGISTAPIDIVDIGWDSVNRMFVDLDGQQIKALYKLYPWEWWASDDFGRNMPQESVLVIEPVWKMILSNKAILAVLWEMFPDHPNLLPAYLDDGVLKGNYVKKPLLGREGVNITVIKDGASSQTDGSYFSGACVYQALHALPDFDGKCPVLGVWVTSEHQEPENGLPVHPRGGRACGMGIREGGLVTDNASRFVPHYFVPSDT